MPDSTDTAEKRARIRDLAGVARSKGLRLKRFEEVVANLLTRVTPTYHELPQLPPEAHSVPSEHSRSSTNRADHNDNHSAPCWPFDVLPPQARVFGTLPGQLNNPLRANKKEQQLHSIIRCICSLIPSDVLASCRTQGGSSPDQTHGSHDRGADADGAAYPYTIVDFGGGSGHLVIPVALLFPNVRVIVVDLGEHSLKLCHVKASAHQHSNRAVRQLSSAGSPDAGVASPAATSSDTPAPQLKITDIVLQPNTIQSCSGIDNLFTYHGPLQTFTDVRFDMGVALHLCGEATDVALRLAGRQQSTALVFAPCCVGKTSVLAKNPYIWQATGSNLPSVTYPQSQLFCQLLDKPSNRSDCAATSSVGTAKAAKIARQDQREGDALSKRTAQDASQLPARQSSTSTAAPVSLPPFTQVQHRDSELGTWQQDWAALAKAADYSQVDDFRTTRNAARRTAKALLETDRRMFLAEAYGYQTLLTRMDPWEATPKNDILLAWRNGSVSVNTKVDDNCQADIRLTVNHLLRPATKACSEASMPVAVHPTEDDHSAFLVGGKVGNCSSIDWTATEEQNVRFQLEQFASSNPHDSNNVFLFPTKMGGRRRKLIHFVAQSMGLAHWSHGDKDSEKTVAVSRRGRRLRTQRIQADDTKRKKSSETGRAKQTETSILPH